MHKPLTTNNVTQFINLHHDEFSEEQKALIMARFGIRAKLDCYDSRLQRVIYRWFREDKGQIGYQAVTVRQVADIIKANIIISKYDLIKECERVLSCRGEFRRAINKSLRLLVNRNIVKMETVTI